MAEEQCERLRKENLALKARLQAALAAVAACGSPVAGPAALAMRMAQVRAAGRCLGPWAGPSPPGTRLPAPLAPHPCPASAACSGWSRLWCAARCAQHRRVNTAPTALHQRVQAGPEGNGRGAGGTPHDVALARARQAAAAEEMAAAGGPAGSAAAGSSRPRSRSRFAEQAEALCDGPPADLAAAVCGSAQRTLPTEAAAAAVQGEQAEQQQQLAPQPAPRRRGRAKKAVAFAGIPEEQEAEPSMQREQPSAQQAQPLQETPPAAASHPAAESRRARRMTRATATLQQHHSPAQAAPLEVQPQQQAPQQPVQQAQQAQLEAAAAPRPAKERRGRRHTQAKASGEPSTAAAEVKPAARSVSLLPALQPALRLPQRGDEQPPHEAAPAACKSRAAGAGKENATDEVAAGCSSLADCSEDAQAAAEASPPRQPGEQRAAGKARGKRRKRLLPSAAMSADMRAALGELEDGSLRQRVAAKQASAARQAAAGAAAEEEGGKRRRRQTQFYRL